MIISASLLGGFELAANLMGKNSKKSAGTLDHRKLLNRCGFLPARSSQVNAIKVSGNRIINMRNKNKKTIIFVHFWIAHNAQIGKVHNPISHVRNRISFNSLQTPKQARRHGGHFRGRARPNHCLCFPNENRAPKKLTGSVLLECCSTPETPQNTECHPRIREQELFFRRFCNKHGLFWWFYTRTHQNSRMFGDEDLFFWSSPLNLWKFAHLLRRKPEFKDIFFLIFHLRIRGSIA